MVNVVTEAALVISVMAVVIEMYWLCISFKDFTVSMIDAMVDLVKKFSDEEEAQ